MNDSSLDDLSSSDTKQAKSGSGPAWLALLLALLTALGLAWVLWLSYFEPEDDTEARQAQFTRQSQELAALQTRINSLQSELAGLSSSDTGARLKSVEQSLGMLQSENAQFNAFKAKTDAWARSMQAAIEGDQARIAVAETRLAAVTAQNMNAAAELDLAEIDYVLRLAQERLSLFSDTRTASQALQIAGQQLAVFDNPLYVGLQQDIALARQQLMAVSQPDYSGLYSTLDAMQGSLESLPFKGELPPGSSISASSPEPAEAGWWERVKGALSGLVTVRRSDELDSSPPVLADQAMLRQQAWMELELARLAAMRRDQPAWSASLTRFSSALKRWFDPDSQAVIAMAQQSETLQSQEVDPAMPDISAPWTALQAIRAAGLSTQAATPRAVPPVEEVITRPLENSDNTDDANEQEQQIQAIPQPEPPVEPDSGSGDTAE